MGGKRLALDRWPFVCIRRFHDSTESLDAPAFHELRLLLPLQELRTLHTSTVGLETVWHTGKTGTSGICFTVQWLAWRAQGDVEGQPQHKFRGPRLGANTATEMEVGPLKKSVICPKKGEKIRVLAYEF